MKLKIFSAFTGVGSPDMALKNIGIELHTVGISEVDKYAILAYDAIHNKQSKIKTVSKNEMLLEFSDKNIGYNFSTGKSEIPRGMDEITSLYDAHIRSNNFGDIKKINPHTIPDFDLFTYSFPCKDISVAGVQKGFNEDSDTASSLLWECDKIIEHKKPKYLLMENVKNLIGENHIDGFKKWINRLNRLGYDSYWKLLNGSDFTVPQNRERVMMVSILKEEGKANSYCMPNGKPTNKCIDDILENNAPENMFISPSKYIGFNDVLPSQEISYCIDACYAKGTSVAGYVKKRRRQLVQVGRITGKVHSNKRVYSSDGLCHTLNSMTGGNRQPKVQDEELRIRKLSPLECWRLMGFTDKDFYLAKEIGGLSNSKLYERAGRGIVVPMLEAIFNNLFFNIDDNALSDKPELGLIQGSLFS